MLDGERTASISSTKHHKIASEIPGQGGELSLVTDNQQVFLVSLGARPWGKQESSLWANHLGNPGCHLELPRKSLKHTAAQKPQTPSLIFRETGIQQIRVKRHPAISPTSTPQKQGKLEKLPCLYRDAVTKCNVAYPGWIPGTERECWVKTKGRWIKHGL